LVLPARLLRYLIWPLQKLLGRLMAGPLEQMDESETLSRLINTLSSSMATQRGLPLMIGTVMLVVSLLTHGIVIGVLVYTSDLSRNLFWLCIPFTLLHLGVLAGFTGAMLATPLGQGYQDK
jgi:hypothetical protein